MNENSTLLDWTLAALRDFNLTVDKVRWVGEDTGYFAMRWDEFEELAKEVEIGQFFTARGLAVDLVIVGDSWHLELAPVECLPGTVQWVFRRHPSIKPGAQKIHCLQSTRVRHHSSLFGLNDRENRND